MTAYNVVRFKVKPGNGQKFIDVHSTMKIPFKGFLGGAMIQTGEQTFCLVGEWRNFKSIVAARPQMISLLDSVRDLLEDMGGELGVTDPVSGDTVVTLRAAAKPKKKAKAKAKAKVKAKAKAPAKKKAAKKPAKKK